MKNIITAVLLTIVSGSAFAVSASDQPNVVCSVSVVDAQGKNIFFIENKLFKLDYTHYNLAGEAYTTIRIPSGIVNVGLETYREKDKDGKDVDNSYCMISVQNNVPDTISTSEGADSVRSAIYYNGNTIKAACEFVSSKE